jgi:metal-responsive CopG/Arc/MetJ family transcriptional regulator
MAPRMGRSPLGMKEFKVQLDPVAVEQVDARVGTYRRSAFIRDAIREKLDREAVERELQRREGED